MRYSSSVRGVGTSWGNTKGDRFFRMPTRKVPHPEREVRSTCITFGEALQKVTLDGSVSFR